MTGFRLAQVDAFSDQPFSGNPAAVCLLTRTVSDLWMQKLAKEMNLSETAFLLKADNNSFNLRWFTPTTEVKLCGHATLASAHILWELGYLNHDELANFSTLSGPLSGRRIGEWIELDFPAEPEHSVQPSADLMKALNVPIQYVGKNRFNYLVDVGSEDLVRTINPDLVALKKLPVQGIIVTARSSSQDFDFVSRYFAPNVGVDEDPVTGSAHCCLGPYWAAQLNRSSLVGYQASDRGGIVRVSVNKDRVLLSGKAVTVFTGETSDKASELPAQQDPCLATS